MLDSINAYFYCVSKWNSVAIVKHMIQSYEWVLQAQAIGMKKKKIQCEWTLAVEQW